MRRSECCTLALPPQSSGGRIQITSSSETTLATPGTIAGPDVGEAVQDVEATGRREQRQRREFKRPKRPQPAHPDRAAHPAHRVGPRLAAQIGGRITRDEHVDLGGRLDRQQRAWKLPRVAPGPTSSSLQEQQVQAHAQWAIRFGRHARAGYRQRVTPTQPPNPDARTSPARDGLEEPVGSPPMSTPQRTLHHPRVDSYVAEGLRGRLVRESTRFTLRELAVGLRERRARGSAGPGAREPHASPGRAASPDASPDRVYRVRESGLRVLIAHRTPDVLTLDEIFHQHVYEPPAAVAARLKQLGRPLRAVDLGANVGMWGIWLHGRFPVGQLTALEPEPDNAAKHRRVIELNRLGDSWELIEAAAACADGPVPFTAGTRDDGAHRRARRAGDDHGHRAR